MKIFTLVIAIIFIGVAVFGFLAMNHGQDHGGCIATTSQGSPTCLDALQNFTLAIAPISGAFSIIVFFLLLMVIGERKFFIRSGWLGSNLNIFSLAFWERKYISSLFQAKQRFVSWLTLREKGDAVSSF